MFDDDDEEEDVSVMRLALPRHLRSEWILKAPVTKLSSAEFLQFCAENKELDLEMTASGDILVRDLPGWRHGHQNFNLTGRFGLWVEEDGTGVAFASNVGFTLLNGAVRSPDLLWIKREQWDAIDAEEKESFAVIRPEFLVELRSYWDPLPMLQDKMQEYIENGAQLGWLIDPKEKKVHIYRPGAPVEILDNPAEVSGEPLLKGFTLKLAGILD